MVAFFPHVSDLTGNAPSNSLCWWRLYGDGFVIEHGRVKFQFEKDN